MTTTKPRDVQVVEIGSQTWALRSRTWDRLKFELEYALQKGTTANSYLIRGAQTALIDPPGETFTDIFVEELGRQVDLSQLAWVILGHINPNRAATLRALLELAPQVTLVCSNPAALVLPKLLERHDLSLEIVRGEETLDLGDGHELTLIPTPTPRWPAGLCTYDAATRILYSDKFYGAHLCGDAVWDENWTSLREDRRYYFDCLHATQPRQVLAALEKLGRRPAAVLAPGHGPLVRYGLRDLTRQYRQWSEDQLQQDLTVALFYASAYGNTATLAQAIGRGIAKAEVAVESVNCEFTSPEEMQAILERCDGFIFGSPTLGGHAP
ncbi:MAG: FprA family A-type flavoprotein, partial [Gloeomargaritaceae cyanobacterium C42_A2020_066]|nr:FprA family A-type flavoprotein [Gloeomargaritaceae cyanobacterium C42_A2020_066]